MSVELFAGIAVSDFDRAVDWVRTTYCDRAVETPDQEAFVRARTP